MSALKKLGFAVLHGAAFGFGFLLLAMAVLMGFGSFTFPSRSVEVSDSHMVKQLRPTSDQLVITNAKEVAKTSGAETGEKCSSFPVIYEKQFTGTVENKGPDSDRYLNIYADLFDKDGGFIYQCQTQFQEPLKSGDKQNFLIGCHGLPAAVADKSVTFKIYARGG
ncbi:FxLYD domain-containing protein [Azovibrio restrictus]|uniref:FxLYD domain-containing protein n=1 Tax=Azovibrio restrictus TaxID=146938 RepID=UPI0026ED3309|nr:FxLYD domain-containing protein [Azovibrio restrictus]MDD3484062.1 FxLYD domain-containing protein [Azovibrio restrictus]